MKRLLQNAEIERGQSLVEVAIGFVALLFILSGVLDLGRVYFIFVALEDGAGEAALYLSINPECRYANDGISCADPNNAEFRAKNAGGGSVDWSLATITLDRPALGVGEPVEVIIAYPFQLITPIISSIAGGNALTLFASANQVIIRE